MLTNICYRDTNEIEVAEYWTNANNEATQENAKEDNNRSTNQKAKKAREEDALRARYHAVYPVPQHSYGIFYKR